MKPFIKFSVLIFWIWLYAVSSCKKDREGSHVSENRAPVARVGSDVSVQLSSCADRTGVAELNGSASSDIDGNIASYRWTKIYGPPGEIVLNPYSVTTRVENISPGEYAFELAVKDVPGLVSRDTLMISVKGNPKEYDLDITFNSDYSFKDSATNCGNWYYYYDNCDTHYKSTTIVGRGLFSPVGEFTMYLSELEISVATGNSRSAFIHIYLDNVNSVFLSGNCSVSFASLIEQGGGSFTGTLQIYNGSALACDPDVFANLSALTVAGNLDVAANTVALRLQGKAYF